MKKTFKTREIPSTVLVLMMVCLVTVGYLILKTNQWAALIPLLPPLVIVFFHRRTCYTILEDGRVEIVYKSGRTKVIDQPQSVRYQSRWWLNPMKISYQNTFEKIDPEKPQEFVAVLRQHHPHLKVEGM